MTDHADLISRLEKATGGDRGIDRALFAIDAPTIPAEVVALLDIACIPAYTALLDEAMGLVENALPGVYWHVGTCTVRDGKPASYSADLSCGGGKWDAPTAPLALLRALLRALQTSALSADTGG